MSDNLLMIFVKNLIPGMVKTRLAKDVGMYKALDVYMELVRHTNAITRKLQEDKTVYYSEYVEIDDVWDTGHYKLSVQKGNTLGEKMSIAFDEAFDSYHSVMIIGSDCYELDGKIIKDAFAKLEGHDVVVGPAKDGGYYLLGMKEYHPEFFQDKTYGTDKVLEELKEEVEKLNLSLYELPVLSDVDTLEDLKETDMDWENLGEHEEEEGQGEEDFF